ncbi:MAG: cation-translocating P-type ATPase, partial [Candidatus Odinarchaeota archaeon]
MKNYKETDLKKLAYSEISDVFRELQVEEDGLQSDEVNKRIQYFGVNLIPGIKARPLYKKFIEQFRNLFNILLLIAGLLSIISGEIYNDQSSINMGFIIFGVVILSVFFSLFQEYRAEKAVKELRILIPNIVKVIRNGNVLQINSENLVPGDILILEEGDKVPADIRLISSHMLSVDNSILTGESEPQFKDAIKLINQLERDVLEFENLVLAGTSVISGRGKGIILATGKYTQIARVVEVIDEIEIKLSPIQKEVNRTAKISVIVAISLGFLFLFIILIILELSLLTSILFMIGVIISLVPEGLQVTITLSLALSAVALSRKKVLIKQLSSIHALGAITVICTDKTGTLTENQMMVEKAWISGNMYDITGNGYNPPGKIYLNNILIEDSVNILELNKLGECCIANTHSSIIPPQNRYEARWRAIGDTTDAACLVLGMKIGLTNENIMKKFPKIDDIPFDYIRKITTTIHQNSPSRNKAFAKGAIESVLSKSTTILWDGKIIDFNQDKYKEVMKQAEYMAKEGYRVIAFGEKDIDTDQKIINKEEVESAFTFIGFVGIFDPPHKGVSEAVAQAHKAGIKVIMITGDHELTAENIARKVGIISSSTPKILTGSALSTLKEDDLVKILDSPEIVFARMNPEQKLKIVSLLKQKGEIIAVTGDGVNDVPALHAADVGVAMGLAGTQVAIEASQMVLLDDNFASIVKGIEGGRSIMDNLKRFMKYVFTHNWAQLVGFLVFILWDIPIPISVIIILSIDLIMEIPPSFALILEPPEAETLERPPQKNFHLFTFSTLFQSMYLGLIIGIYSLYKVLQLYSSGGWVLGMQTVPDPIAYSRGITIFLVGIMAGQLGNLFACRTHTESALNRRFFHNKWLFIAITVELGILFSIIYIPFIQIIFNTTALSVIEMIE